MKWNWPSWWPSWSQEKCLERLTETNANPTDAAEQRAILPELNKHGLATSFNIFQAINEHVTLKRKRMKEDLKIKVPGDIIYDIFLRLPVKSLLRFRSISKDYCDIIDSLGFANMHVISTQEIDAEERQLLPPWGGHFSENIVYSYIYNGEEIRESDHPIMEFSGNDHGYAIETVAYGLFLFRNLKRVGEVFLYNPLRGEVLVLPQPLGALTDNDLKKEGLAVYGIGFDNCTDSYKIVRTCRNPLACLMGIDNIVPLLSDQLRFETEVYILGTSSWRVISSSVCFPLFEYSSITSMGVDGWLRPTIIMGVSAYGDMHWMCWDYNNRNARVMSFDFKREEFKDTPLPNFGWQHIRRWQEAVLFDLKGFLAIFKFPLEDRCIDIWVLNYEKNEWIREYRITTDQVLTRAPTNNVVIHGSNICLNVEILTPVGVCGHDGFVFECFFGLFILDLKTNRILNMHRPYSYISQTRKVSYVSNILCLRNFGNPIEEYPSKYSFLKTARRFYVAT